MAIDNRKLLQNERMVYEFHSEIYLYGFLSFSFPSLFFLVLLFCWLIILSLFHPYILSFVFHLSSRPLF
jgi:hypothetical protein